MPRQGPRRLPAGERDRRLAEEVLYLHSLWRRGPHAPGPAPAPAPIQSRSARREELARRVLRRQELERLTLYRLLHRKERKRRRIDRAAAAAAELALAPPPPASSRETLAGAAGASAPSTANPPPPKTPPGSLAQRPMVEFTNRGSAGDHVAGSDADGGEKAEEQEAAAYFTGLFERDAWLRGHYTGRWRKGQFQCMVCAAGGGSKVGKAVRRFRGCLALVHHARDSSRGRSLCGRYGGRRGAHRALAIVVCRMLGWDIENLALPRAVIDPPATAGVQHAKENDGAGENNGYSTDDDSYSIDEDEESDEEESVDEEEDIETGMPDPATDGDEEDSEIESNEEYAEKEDHENMMEDSSTDGDEDANELERSKEADQKICVEDADTVAEGSKITDGDKEAIELDNSEKIPEKEAANSVSRKRDMKIRDHLLRLTHAKPMDTTPKKTEVRKRSRLPIHEEVLTPGSKFNEGSGKAKRQASYQGQSSISGVVKVVEVNQQPSNKGKRSKTKETRASARKAKRPAVAARKAKLLAMKLKKREATSQEKQGGCLNS